MESTKPRISIVIATFNRVESLGRLLRQLAVQTMAPAEFEVVVVDDGSLTPLPEVAVPYRLSALRQENRGAAAARHLGATTATADVVLFIDDDMEVPPELLREHIRLHDNDVRAVVLGWIKCPTRTRMPLYERLHARYLDHLAEDACNGRWALTGIDVWSGNISMRRAQYLKVGGFDTAFGLGEDAELGLRLEKGGATFYVSEKAYSDHHSDHASLGGWMKRSHRYGRTDLRISRKHPEMRHANPWRYWYTVTLVSCPFLAVALAAPWLGHLIARAAMAVATSLDAGGMERAALGLTDLAFAMEYTRGLRDEAGGCVAALRDFVRYRQEGPKVAFYVPAGNSNSPRPAAEGRSQ